MPSPARVRPAAPPARPRRGHAVLRLATLLLLCALVGGAPDAAPAPGGSVSANVRDRVLNFPARLEPVLAGLTDSGQIRAVLEAEARDICDHMAQPKGRRTGSA